MSAVNLSHFSAEGGSTDFGTYEPFESFKPSQQEDLSTGEFPTITCFEDLLQYKQNLANMGRHSLASDSSDDSTHRPINVAANATGSKPVQVFFPALILRFSLCNDVPALDVLGGFKLRHTVRTAISSS